MAMYVTSPITDIRALTPSDAADNVPSQARGLHNRETTSILVAVYLRNDDSANSRSLRLNSGDFLEIGARRVLVTGTTGGAAALISWFT